MPKKVQDKMAVKLLTYANQARIDGHFNDVVIKAGNEKFPANKLVLSCFSSFFEKMFLADMKERYQDTIEIKDFDGKAITHLLKYIYTEDITIDSENVMKLLSAANYLQIQEVVDSCFDFLKDSISIETWSTIFSALQLYQNNQLLSKIYKFVGKNLKQIIQTDDFKELKSTEIISIISNLDRNNAESHIYKGVMSWIQHDEGNRKSELHKMFELIKLENLPIEFLEDVVICDPLVSSNVDCLKATTILISQQFKQMRRNQAGDFKILRVGGDSENKDNRIVEEVYSLNSKVYPKLPYDLSFCVAINFKNHIYSIGGDDNVKDNTIKATNKVIRMNLKTMQLKWENVPSMAEKRRYPSAAEFHNCLVVAGGTAIEKPALDSVECFDPVLSQWQQLSKLNQARYSHQLVECNNLLYAFGGWIGSVINKDLLFCLMSVEKLCSLDGDWEDSTPMNVPRAAFAALAINGVIFVIGGASVVSDRFIVLSSVEKFNPLDNTWTRAADMKYARKDHAACILGKKILVVGGKNERNDYVHTIECYDPERDSWKNVGELKNGAMGLSVVTT